MNPYNSAKPGQCFTGYGELRRAIALGLDNGKSFAVLGGRRCGKTSLLRQLQQELAAPCLPRYLDMQAELPTSAAALFGCLARAAVQDCGVAPWTPPANGDSQFAGFVDYLKRCAPALTRRHGPDWRVLWLIDEVEVAAQRLPNDDGWQQLRSFLMNSELAHRFAVVIVGVGGLSDLVKSGSPLNFLETRYLTHLAQEEARRLISHGFAARLAEADIARLLQLSGGHPWLLQSLLEDLWNQPDTLDSNAVHQAKNRLLRYRDGVFQTWARDISEGGRALYQALAAAPGQSLAPRQWRPLLPAGAGVTESLNALYYHGLCDDTEEGGISLNGTLFREWFGLNQPYLAEESPLPAKSEAAAEKNRRVFVVYGRDRQFYAAVCLFLRSLKLEPLEWNSLVEATGKGAPTIFEIIEQGFAMAAAALVLLTPDDEARLRPAFLQNGDPDYERDYTPQARPNVLFEAGLAMAKFRDKTILAQTGKLRPFSDVAGLHWLQLDNELQNREHFAKRLEACGLPVDLSGTYWHTAGDLTPSRGA